MRVQRDPRRTIRSIRYFTGEHCLSSAQGITAPEATEATAAASRRIAGTPTHGYVDPRMLDWFIGGALTIHPRKARSWRKVAVVCRELNRA